MFEADPPDTKRIPIDELLGVTVILLTCAYDGREFVRVGYYVNNEYESDELRDEPPAKPDVEKIRRNVLANKPRVTRFAIKWYVVIVVAVVVLLGYPVGLISGANETPQGFRGFCPSRIPARAA